MKSVADNRRHLPCCLNRRTAVLLAPARARRRSAHAPRARGRRCDGVFGGVLPGEAFLAGAAACAVSSGSRRATHRLVYAALALVLPLALTGCGGDGDGQKERAEIQRELITAIRAAHAGDTRTACSRYTRAYVRETAAENRALKLQGESCDEVVRRLEPVLRQLTPDPRPKVERVKVSGDRANARMEIETYFGRAATRVFLVRDGGRWKIDHDEDYPHGT